MSRLSAEPDLRISTTNARFPEPNPIALKVSFEAVQPHLVNVATLSPDVYDFLRRAITCRSKSA
jgi:hypothetical protein